MTRLVAPDRGAIETEVRGRRYRGRIIDVQDPRSERLLREEGYFPASVGGVPKASGHQCPTCKRYNFLKTCGRCEARAAATND